MRISKKILAIALSVLMAVSMMPFTVFASALPTAKVTDITNTAANDIGLEAAYLYELDEAAEGDTYNDYLADFVVTFDTDLPANAVELWGKYDATLGENTGEWTKISNDDPIVAGQPYQLLKESGYWPITYEMAATIIQQFYCGVNGLNAAGATMTVKLNLYADEESAPITIDSATAVYTFDEDEALPTATATDITDTEANDIGLEKAYLYEATAAAEGSAYADYLADFVVTFDKDLPANAVELWGKYEARLGDNTGEWTKLEYNDAIVAGKEYHLLRDSNYWPITYAMVADVIGQFYCGVKGLDAAGATMTVKLNLYANENASAKTIEDATVSYTFEDEDALPTVTVTPIEAPEGMDAAYLYEADQTDADYAYNDYLADFVVTFDQDLPAGAVKLWGKYDAALGENTGNWTAIEFNEDIVGGQEYHLLQESGYWPITYDMVANTIQQFYCGVEGLNAAGATMTVQLKLYEDAEDDGVEVPNTAVSYTFLEEAELPTVTVTDISDNYELNDQWLEAAYLYEADPTNADYAYNDYLADFVVTFDQDLPANAVQLWGKYSATLGENTGEWMSIDFNEPIVAGQEYHLLQESGYWPITYDMVANTIKQFYCGVQGLDASGATMNVKLNLYKNADSQAIEIPNTEKSYTFPVYTEDWFDVTVYDTMQFHLSIQDSRAAKVVFEYNGTPEVEGETRVTKTVTREEAEVMDNIYYCNFNLAPAQAYDKVTYKVYNTAGDMVRENTTSAAEYLLLVLGDEDWAAYHNLSRALYDYCKAAAEYFNYNAEAYEQPYFYEVAQWKTSFWTCSDTTGKIAVANDVVSYVATSEPALRIKMALTEEEAAELSVSSTVGTAGFFKRGNDVVLNVSEIPLSKLHTPVCITIDGVGEINYTPLLYAYQAAESNNAALARLCTSIANANYEAASIITT